MRAVVQRVAEARVKVREETVAEIGRGLAVLLGIERDDTEKDIDYLVDKIVHLRIFDDQEGKLNLSVKGTGGEVLVVSQFTLLGDCRRGRRPGYSHAAPAEIARETYSKFLTRLKEAGVGVSKGIFQEKMLVEIFNDGPVTLLLDSRKTF
jgi:D-tyrosyl-tRNA(Tyr) deacylase